MFKFFSKEPKCPVTEEIRIWMENAFIWLINQFGEEKILNVKQMLPVNDDFPVSFQENTIAAEFVSIISKQMNVDENIIELNFYNDAIQEIDTGGSTIFTQQFEDQKYSSGIYTGRNEKNRFPLYLERQVLKDPYKLVATLAHEISHIKILGENRLQENDEYLTDLVTVFFGLGIFTANASFKFYKDDRQWGYSKQGYLTQQEWAFALALFAYIRHERNPDWIKFLSPNIKRDFRRSEKYIYKNTDKVLV